MQKYIKNCNLVRVNSSKAVQGIRPTV